jgi:hypothetical protein
VGLPKGALLPLRRPGELVVAAATRIGVVKGLPPVLMPISVVWGVLLALLGVVAVGVMIVFAPPLRMFASPLDVDAELPAIAVGTTSAEADGLASALCSAIGDFDSSAIPPDVCLVTLTETSLCALPRGGVAAFSSSLAPAVAKIDAERAGLALLLPS